jgi:murein DD-endopeptidase MepM/ murein hydrolase activator NlpD
LVSALRPTTTSRIVAVAVLAALAVGSAAGSESDPITERLAVVDKTEKILVDKNEIRAAELRARIRTLYKLSRAGWAPLWIDGDERAALLRRRGAARRILVRDLAELQILRDELDSVVAARARLDAAAETAEAVARPAPRSLTRPVPGGLVSAYGHYRGRRSKARLVNRGIKLASRKGESVRATHAGTVAYAGPLRELRNVVVIARDDGVRSVIGELGELAVRAGVTVEPGDEIGLAAGTRVYLEVRIDLGAGGLPINPAPLLR